MADDHTEELRALTRTREKLVEQTTALRNEWRAQGVAFGLVCSADDVLSRKAERWLAEHFDRLPSWGQFCWQRLRESLLSLREQIKLLEREIERQAAPDPACQKLRWPTPPLVPRATPAATCCRLPRSRAGGTTGSPPGRRRRRPWTRRSVTRPGTR